MSTAVYFRVSTNLQDAASQKFALKMLCAQRGWEYPTRWEYHDHAKSGANASRKDYQRLVGDIQGGKVTRVLCTDMDRVGRDPDERARFIHLCREKGVEVVEAGGTLKLETPEGWLLERIKAAVAEYERSKIKARCVAGIRAKIARGEKWGPVGRKIQGEQLAALQAEPAGQSYAALARKYGVNPHTIRKTLGKKPKRRPVSVPA